MAADGRWRSTAVAGLVTIALAACGTGESAEPEQVGVPVTVAIGGLPGPLSGTTLPTLPEVTAEVTTTSTTIPRRIDGPLAEQVTDHRVLLIGDTALAATTPRAGGIMCDVLTGFGWDVAIEAEPGRPLAFATEVLDAVGDDEWGVVGLMFGHHVPDSVDDFEQSLDELLDRLAPRPVVVFTVAELGEEQVGVNELLRDRSSSRPNVVLVDWAESVAAEPDVLLDGGGPRPTDEGAGRLALFTAALLSRTSDGRPGTCIDPVFTDDSAIVL